MLLRRGADIDQRGGYRADTREEEAAEDGKRPRADSGKRGAWGRGRIGFGGQLNGAMREEMMDPSGAAPLAPFSRLTRLEGASLRWRLGDLSILFLDEDALRSLRQLPYIWCAR